MEQQWNDTDREKPKDLEKNPRPSANSSTTNPTQTALEVNLDLCFEKLGTNHLCYGMVKYDPNLKSGSNLSLLIFKKNTH
jgi:hypothetical protein